jgi:nucleotide-binding universal stress UspA family protein
MSALVEAHLTAAAFVAERRVSLLSEFPSVLLEAMYEESRRSAEQALRGFEEASGVPSVATELVAVPPGQSVEDRFRWLARHFDLTIVQQPSPDRPVNDYMLEAVLFGSGRPIIVVPYAHRVPAKFDTVVIAWDEGAAAARAISDALPLLKKAARVELVTVTQSSDSSGGASTIRMVEHLTRHNIQTTSRSLPAAGGTAETLLSYAADALADLLVMGGYGHSRLRELILGGTTRTMLTSMTVPVLMAH